MFCPTSILRHIDIKTYKNEYRWPFQTSLLKFFNLNYIKIIRLQTNTSCGCLMIRTSTKAAI